MEPVIIPDARKHGVADDDILHAWANRIGLMTVVGECYRHVGRTLVWTPVDLSGRSAEGGAMAQAAAVGFGLQARRVGGPAKPEELAEALRLPVYVPVFEPPERNSTCGCGSGERAERCCWATTRDNQGASQ